MAEMKMDMGGAATVVAALHAIAALKVPVNVTVVTPLVENMPDGSATKPGDVVTAMDGYVVLAGALAMSVAWWMMSATWDNTATCCFPLAPPPLFCFFPHLFPFSRAHDSTTIEVDNTDAEGRLLLADALAHAADICKQGEKNG